MRVRKSSRERERGGRKKGGREKERERESRVFKEDVTIECGTQTQVLTQPRQVFLLTGAAGTGKSRYGQFLRTVKPSLLGLKPRTFTCIIMAPLEPLVRMVLMKVSSRI